MKKVLSIILALALIVTCLPVAFAIKLPDNEAALYNELVRMYSNTVAYYKIGDELVSDYDLYDYGMLEIYSVLDDARWYEDLFDADGAENWFKANPEILADCAAELKAVNDSWDELCKENGYVKLLDVTRYAYFALYTDLYYGSEKNDGISDFLDEYVGREITDEWDDVLADGISDFCDKIEEDMDSVTQEDFDNSTSAALDFFYQCVDCFEGNHLHGEYTDLGNGTHKTDCTFCKTTDITEAHTYGEYISNNNATTEADGTKTAKCTKCTATDTVADEGTKLPPEENNDSDSEDFFTSIINAIKNFFNQIADFFKNLFG